jgi:hypothetical protein
MLNVFATSHLPSVRYSVRPNAQIVQSSAENDGKLGPVSISKLAKALGISRAQLQHEDPEQRSAPMT